MSDRFKEDPRRVEAPVLDAALLARIHELNLDYVELLIADYIAGGRSPYFLPLPATVLEALIRLSHEQRQRLAATPYSLYCVNLESISLRRGVSQPFDAQPAVQRYEAMAAEPAHAAFCEVALFLAWHVCISNPLAARVLYALPPLHIAGLACAPLWTLRRVAVDSCGLPMPRWPANPCFWPDLAHFAAADDRLRLRAAQLLGNQLVSMELERMQRPERGGARAPALRNPMGR